MKYKGFIPVALGLLLWLTGSPAGLAPQAYHLFIVFLVVIASLMIRIVPLAVSVLMGITFVVLTGILPLKSALSGYGDTTTWLVVIAFLIAGAVIETGLGRRISLLCIAALGKSITGLGYAICLAEFILGPVVPSNTARGGGILAPIVDSMARTLGSSPKNNPGKAGQYLHLVGAHANLITAAMFLTGMAANPLVAKAALDIFEIQFDWFTWVKGGIVPGLVGLAGLPILMRFLSPPTIESIQAVRGQIDGEIRSLGPWSSREIAIASILGVMLLLWSTKPVHGWGTTTVALFGLILLLISNTMTWDQLVKNHKAWDTLIWLGGLLALANGLKEVGFIAWFGDLVKSELTGVSPIFMLIVLALIYFYSMYVFSMLTAHIAALAGTIFLVASGVELNPILVVGVIAYFSNLCGCLTNYSTGPVIIYFGNGYVQPLAWFRIGLLVSFYHLVVWLGVGSIWWRIIGWW